MKRNHHTRRALACLLLVALLCTALLSSCARTTRNVSGTEINDLGELIVYYSDGTSENLGLVKGADGARGEAGQNGADGEDGRNGKDGQDGKDGLNGQNGRDGRDGANGQNGVITVIPDSDTVALAAAKGLRSAVRIRTNTSAGSGVIWQLDRSAGDAKIITNHHVVYENYGISDTINLYLYGGEYADLAIEATYVGGSKYYDIAVLSVTGSDILRNSDAVAVTVADSENVFVGSEAIAVGNPADMGLSVSLGIVSVDSEQIKMTAVDGITQIQLRVMRMDTAVNSGNSGGGLYNSAGELIGIVNAKIADSSIENIGYAIPSNLAIAVAQNIVDYCFGTNVKTAMRAMIGVTIGLKDSYSAYDATTGHMKTVETVIISEVATNGAAQGILQTNDVLLSATLGETTLAITRSYHLTELMLEARAGDTLTLDILRNGQELTVTIPIAAKDIASY